MTHRNIDLHSSYGAAYHMKSILPMLETYDKKSTDGFQLDNPNNNKIRKIYIVKLSYFDSFLSNRSSGKCQITAWLTMSIISCYILPIFISNTYVHKYINTYLCHVINVIMIFFDYNTLMWFLYVIRKTACEI